MLDVEDGLVDQVGHVRVVERVHDHAPAALPDDEPQVAKQPKLVGDG